MEKSFDFIRREIERYGLTAQFALCRECAAEYEIGILPDGTAQICAADSSGVLHGVYMLAEKAGWSFFHPGSDRYCPELKEKLTPGRRITAPEPLLALRGIVYDAGEICYLPEMVDWMGKNRMNILVCRNGKEPAPETAEMLQLRGIRILHDVPLFTAENRCVNHMIAETCCTVNRKWREKLQSAAAGEVLIYADFMGVDDRTPLIHFDELFCEAEFYSRSGVQGIVMPPEPGRRHWQGMNRYLLARSAAGEEKLETVDRMFTALYGNEAWYARRFFAAVKDLLLSAGGCGSYGAEDMLAGVTDAEWEELAAFLEGISPGSEVYRWWEEMRQNGKKQ